MKTSRILILCLLLLSLPMISYSSQLVYTIQTASYTNIDDALNQYNFIQLKLDEEELYYLRIEKIGHYLSVRLGDFKDYNSAEKFFQKIRHYLPAAIILKAYIKNKRIIILYLGSQQ